jgi:hypothetical protein
MRKFFDPEVQPFMRRIGCMLPVCLFMLICLLLLSSCAPYEPSIGMSKDQILNSTWGKPDKTEKIIYDNGIYEYWVYNTYLESHLVIMFRDNEVISINRNLPHAK